MKKCIIILGMHRSGTSLISGLVSLQGFHLGASKMPKHKDNPKGFFENMKIFRFNDKILKDHNTSWDNYSFHYKDIETEKINFYKLEAKKIIQEEFANTTHILIKDPRMSLLFPLWEDVLLEMGFNIKIILVFRNPIEVSLSLQQRNGFTLEKSIPIWLHYSLQAEKNSKKYKIFLVYYTYDLNHFDDFIISLSNFLNIKLTQHIINSSNNLYTPKLRHHKIELEEILDSYPSEVKELFSILKKRKLNLVKKTYHKFYNQKKLGLYKNNRSKIEIEDNKIQQYGLIYTSNKNCRNLEKEINNKNPPILNKKINIAMLVSIIIINRNGMKHLLNLIPALYKNTSGINYELIVIDNASSDDSIIFLENCNYDINLKIIRNKNNESFSRANNKAATYAKGKYLLLLNNDTKPLKGWLNYLLNIAETKNNIGSVGSRLIYPHRKTFQKSCNIQHAGIVFQDEVNFFRPFNQGNDTSHNSKVIENPGAKSALTAACLLVPTKIYQEVGGFDEQYIFGYEDVDLGLKLIKAGYLNYYCPDSVLFHYEFGTQDKDNHDDIIKRRKSNIDLLRQRWFTAIKKNYWEEKLYNKSHLFSEMALQIAIIVTDYGKNITAEDYLIAKEFSNHFNSFGWTTFILSPVNNNYYKIDNKIDVVISLLETYHLEKIPKREKRLTTIAWTRNHLDLWCKTPNFNQYDIVFTPNQNSCDYIQTHSYQEPILFPISSSPKIFNHKNKALIRSTMIKYFLSTSVVINIPSPTWTGISSCVDYHIAIFLKKKLEQQGYYVLLQIYPEWESNRGMGCDVVLVLRGMYSYKPKDHQVNIIWNTTNSNEITTKEYRKYDAIFLTYCKKSDRKPSTQLKTVFKRIDADFFHNLIIKSNQQKMLFEGNLNDIYKKITSDLTSLRLDLLTYDKKRGSIILNQHMVENNSINNETSKYYSLAFAASILTGKSNTIKKLEDLIHTLESSTNIENQLTYHLEQPNVNINHEVLNSFILMLKNNKNKQLNKLNTISNELHFSYKSTAHNDTLLRDKIAELESKLITANEKINYTKENANNKLNAFKQKTDEEIRISNLNATNKSEEIKAANRRANERVKEAKQEAEKTLKASHLSANKIMSAAKHKADEALRIANLNASNKAKEIKAANHRANERVKEANQQAEKNLLDNQEKADKALAITNKNTNKKLQMANLSAEKKLKSARQLATQRAKESSQYKAQAEREIHKKIELKQEYTELKQEHKESIERLSVAKEAFYKVFSSRSWNKKLGRTINGQHYFKLKKIIRPWQNKDHKKLLQEKALIIESGLFSVFYYLTHNSDVWYKKVDPLSHFCQHGWKQGRNPSPDFNINDYLSMYKDVGRTGINPLIHYIKFGKPEGRRTILNTKERKNQATKYKKKTNTLIPAVAHPASGLKQIGKTKGSTNSIENGILSARFSSSENIPVLMVNGIPNNTIEINPKSGEFTAEITTSIHDEAQVEVLALSEKGISSLHKKTYQTNWAVIDKYADLEKAALLCQQPNAVAITVWDGAHNPIGRAKVLHDIISTQRPAIIFAYIFGPFGDHLWGPLRTSGTPIILIPYAERLAYHTYFQQRNITFNTIWICKYRLHSFELASMISTPETACILDMDDNEDVFVSSKNSELQPYGIFSKNKADYFLNKTTVRSVASASLLKNYGGRLIRHARQPYSTPISPRKENNSIGTAVFIGTIRPHKNITSLVDAIAHYNKTTSDKIKLAIGGDFDPISLKQTLNTSDTIILDEIHNNELFDTLAQFDVLITGFPDPKTKSKAINKYQITSKIGDGLAIGRPVLTPYSPAVADLKNIAGLFIFTDKNFNQKLKQAMQYKEKILLPKQFTLNYSYQTFAKLERTAQKTSLAKNIFELEPLYQSKRLPTNKTKNIVLIWKQHDSGIYGRRIDHIARYYKQQHPDCHITVIEAMTEWQINHTLDVHPPFDNSTTIVNEVLEQKIYQYDVEGVTYRMMTYDDRYEWSSFNRQFANFLSAESIHPYNTVMILFPLHPIFDDIIHLLNNYPVIVDLVDNQINWITTAEGKIKGLKQYYDLISIADKVVSNSPQNLEYFRKMGFFDKIMPEIIANWYTLPRSISFQRKLNPKEINLIYSGNMNDRIDWELLKEICQLLAKHNGHLHIAGSTIRRAEEMQGLLKEPNCIYHGVVREEQLLRLLQHINFAVIPHIEDKISKFMDPIKLKMYAKLGIPSLTTKLPGLAIDNPMLIIAKSKSDFLRKLNNMLEHSSSIIGFNNEEMDEQYSKLIDQTFSQS